MNMKERDILWAPSTGVGLEHLRLTEDNNGYYASSVVIGMKYGKPFSARYSVRCDADWRVREVIVQLLHPDTGGKSLELLAEDEGHWRLFPDQRLEALDGCIDVDITATPFTNTLPIRRLMLGVGQSAELLVAYIALPEMDITPVRQRYTCLETSAYGGLYRYEGLTSGFTREIRVDADGLVIDYPGLFQRV
jgi:uncharacterized protein